MSAIIDLRIHTFLLVLVLLIVYGCAPAACAIIQVPKTHVEIYNDLSPQSPLTLHCKSKNDDLGMQVFARDLGYVDYCQPTLCCRTAVLELSKGHVGIMAGNA
ncbi:hypothetical protein FRX31_024480 [Thalictrum thalictroides]|uniref:S-protein homolog n=1 Tax=Thalictrum thalictroides TaxID=46969 RepID=A0A7J6VP23_THATH|nr:hypothetical protein FRX31_024480 [Thalictrum thalictroides]